MSFLFRSCFGWGSDHLPCVAVKHIADPLLGFCLKEKLVGGCLGCGCAWLCCAGVVPWSRHKASAGEAQQLATGIAANEGKGGGKGGLLWAMWVWVGLGAIQAPHKKRRAATSGIAGPPRPTQLAAKKIWYQYNSQY